ncbi:MAG TPA: hypothetical protein VFN21_02485 [Acidimicrobiales bacterium]|nr:hypothetical protein [Acidimicrobiales bacterium]
MSDTDSPRKLALHELQYLRELDTHLRDLPRSRRTELLGIADGNLADRPTTADGPELEAQLGSPGDYASDLRAERELPPERTDWWARWTAKSRTLRYLGVCLALVTVAGVVTGFVTYQRWAHWQADIETIGEGVTYAGTEPTDGIDEVRAGGLTQANVPFRHGRALQVDLMLYSSEEVTLTGIMFDGAGPGLLGPATIEVRSGSGDAAAFRPFRPVSLRSSDVWIRFVMPFQGCEGYGSEGDSGGYTSYTQVTARYRARGRERTQTLALPVVVSVLNPAPGECPAMPQPK